MAQRPSSGGAAAAGGMDFQARVAAWVAVHILAEKDATPPWDLPSEVTLEWLRCQSKEAVDDLLVGTSVGGYIFAQIKECLDCSKTPTSDLASALDQFIRQFINRRTINQPLHPMKDRLVLITSSKSSEPIRIHLPTVLRRVQRNQPFSEATSNKKESNVFSVVKEHLERSWQRILGIDPSEEDLRQLLSLIHIQILDVDKGEVGEREAINLLRRAVLQDPDQAEAAWMELISLASLYATERSGADRSILRRSLLEAGFDLKVVRSYQEDINKLKKNSMDTFEALSRFTRIRVGCHTVRIQRPCVLALRQAAEEGSILVVGEPGAGKSGVLHNFAEMLKEEGRDWLFLAVTHLSSRSIGELRTELGLEHDLIEVLENWPGLKPGFILIDALDAARGEPAQRMIQNLISQIIQKNGRWHVVASIREFDFYYGEEIKNLFAGTPFTEFSTPEFKGIRHVNVQKFSGEELEQIGSQSPELDAFIRNALPELQELLRVPFNLQLMGELIGTGVSRDELKPIKTKIELLNKYWNHRVCHGEHGDAREAVLREACEKMVNDRMLRIERSAIARPETSVWLHELLSMQILIEWQPSPEAPPNRYILAFSHHVLFDYVVAKLLLQGTLERSDTLVQRLVNDPDLAIVIRPSLIFHFHYLWSIDHIRRQFWELVFRIIREDRLPEIGKIIGLSVAAELARTLSDLEPLCAALDDVNPANQSAAEQALRHLAGALVTRTLVTETSDNIRLLGPDAGPWCGLLERISRNLRLPVAYSVRYLLSVMCERPEDFTSEQRTAAGETARRLLEFAWAYTPRNSWLVIHALQCVCRTFESDPAASAALIRRCLELPHLSQYGFEEMPWLARELKRLIPLDQRLVEEIYRAAFTYEETSGEPTPFSQSRILPLISNRRQDYQSALYIMAKVFPAFLEAAPENATRALIAVMEIYVNRHHRPASGEWQEKTFDFNGRQVYILTDYSAIWDEGDTYRHDEPLRMLDSFQQYLERLAEQKNGATQFYKLLEILISENRLAVLWRRVLSMGARFPNTVGKEILPLAWAVPILTGFDTMTLAGNFIRAIFSPLNPELRERIEQAILSIPETVPADRRQSAEHIRNRLLGCLTAEKLVTDEARRLLEELKSKNAIPPNEPPVQYHQFSGRPYGEEEYLKDQGIPVDAEPNRKIRELEGPVKEFTERHLNSAPVLEEASEVLPALRALHEALSRADTGGVHPKQRDYAWDSLAAACACIARADGLSCDVEPGSFIRTVLLEASHQSEPTHHPEYDVQFDEHTSWASPAARLEAAKGLVMLARHPGCVDPQVLEAIERLSNDPVPAARFQIARGLYALYHTAPDLMWRIAERMCREELSRGVLQGLLTGPLQRIAGAEQDRVAGLIKVIFDRVREGPGADKVREFCVGLFASLYIWRNHAICCEIVLEIASNALSFPEEAHHILGKIRNAVTYGPTSSSDSNADAIRQRALDLIERLLRSARAGLRDLEQCNRDVPFNQWPQQDQDKTKSLMQLIDRIGDEVYFVSGAHDSQRQLSATRMVKPESERFYREAGAILDELAEAALASVTHHLIETLELYIPLDPRGVFLRIGHVLRAGQQGGYQYESLAVDRLVELVERYIADHRTLLREDSECRRTLIEILDIFVQAGWPKAQRLTYRLEEIFR